MPTANKQRESSLDRNSRFWGNFGGNSSAQELGNTHNHRVLDVCVMASLATTQTSEIPDCSGDIVQRGGEHV